MRLNSNTDEDLSLDELINIVNGPKKNTYTGITDAYTSEKDISRQCPKNLPPLEQNYRKIRTNNNNERIGMMRHPQQKNIKPKTLIFKPWSGKSIKYYETYQDEGGNTAIKQQIQNEYDQSYEQSEMKQQAQSRMMPTHGNTKQLGYLYRFQGSKVRLIKCLLDQNGFKQAHSTNKNWTIYWSTSVIKPQIYRDLLPYQRINHFPNSFHLTRKDLMNKSVSKMQQKFGITHFNFLPKTYILPGQIQQLLNQMNSKSYTYIVKPHNRSQGKGITVTSSLETIYSKLQKYSSLIVSHYIGNPLLINRLKFDLRIYVAITSVNPLRIYVFDQGLARFATQQYDQQFSDPQNKKYQHLTNYSVNKKNTQYVSSNNQNQQYYGSKWRLTALKAFLEFNIGQGQVRDLFDRIDQVIVKTIISGENTLYTAFMNNVPYINGCFQVLGFDIMIDSNLKPWLIEINMSPSMNTDSSLDLKIKGNMIADLFTMIGIVPIQERYLDGGHSTYESKYYNKSDDMKTNMSSSGVDRFVVKEVQNQEQRSGSWRRVFPDGKNLNRYKNYFQKDRYFNRLIRQKLSQQNLSHPTSLQPQILRRKSSLKTQNTKSGQYNSVRPVITSNKNISNGVRISRNKGKGITIKNRTGKMGIY